MRKLKLGLVAVAMVAVLGAPVHALGCEGVALDDGCLFTITGGDTPDPNDGYAVTNADGVPMWNFVRDREAQAIGYPISQRWTEGPFTLQAFQKVILQWDPGKQRMNYYNTLDALANRYPWIELPFVPPHQVLEEDEGASFGTIIRNHLALLDQNEAIKERFLSEPDWLNLYGLPIRYEEREVDGNPIGVQLLRTQRTVFVVWQVAAAGVTAGRVNLQNVPDKLKQLSNVVIPDPTKTPVHAPDPQLNPAIRRLSWVADGITGAEKEAVLLLRKLYSSSQELFWRLVFERRVPWIHRSPDVLTEGALQTILAIADITWTRKYIAAAEPPILGMLLHTPRVEWPPAFRTLLHKPWIRDGVTWDELTLADDLLRWVLLGTRPSEIYYQQSADLNNILITMLNMPFMNTYEGYEYKLFDNLLGPFSSSATASEHSQELLHYFAIAGGITDHDALLFLTGPLDDSNLTTQEYAEAIMRRADNFTIEQRTVILASSGPIQLVLIHYSHRPIHGSVMGTLESVLREVVTFMEVPFPHDHLVLKVTYGQTWNGQFGGRYISIVDDLLDASASSMETRRVLSHLIGHYYWQNNGRLIDDGVVTTIEYALGYRSPEWPPEAGDPESTDVGRYNCTFNTIDAATYKSGDSAGRVRSDCARFFGPRLFMDLYRSLDEASFHKGLSRLMNSVHRGLNIYCFDEAEVLGIPCIRPERIGHLTAITEAFTTDATPEAAATARAVIGRWYYGDPGALTSP